MPYSQLCTPISSPTTLAPAFTPKLLEDAIDLSNRPNVLGVLQYGRENTRQNMRHFFRERGISYDTIDQLNNVICYMIRENQDTILPYFSTTIPDCFRAFLLALHQYVIIELLKQKITDFRQAVIDSENEVIRLCCQLGIKLAPFFR